VHQGNTQVNLEKIDLIIRHLNLIKKAMLESASRQEAARLAQAEHFDNEVPERWEGKSSLST
jgi:hypothetical protein